MTDIAQRNGVFHFEDLHVGQRFSSGTHALDEAQIKSFARATRRPSAGRPADTAAGPRYAAGRRGTMSLAVKTCTISPR